MRLSEMTKVRLSQLDEADVIIANSVVDDAGKKKIKKNLVYANSIAIKEDVVAISQQTTQILKVIGALTTKVTNLEKKLKAAENINNKLSEKITELEQLISNECLTY